MVNDIILEIDESFIILGRGLMLLPKDFQFVAPKGVPKPFSDHIVLVSTDGTYEDVEVQILIEHFSLASGNDELYGGRYSLVLLLPEKPEANLPAGSRVRVSESTLRLMKNMVEHLSE